MAEVHCPATVCSHNKDKLCSRPRIDLLWRAAIDFPGKGTIVYYECDQQELPQDRENG